MPLNKLQLQSKHVAILLPDLRGGGVEKIRLVLARQFRDFGWTATFLLARRDGPWLGEVESEFEVVDLRARRLRGVLRPLIRYLGKERPEVLLAAMWPLTSIAVLAAKFAGVGTKVVVSEHNDFLAPGRNLPLEQRVLMQLTMSVSHRVADQVVGVSDGVARTIATMSCITRSRVGVINNPVEMSQDDVETLVEPLDPPAWSEHRGPRLIAIGSFKEQKDFASAIKALMHLRETHDAKLIILGDGPLRPALEQLVVELQLRDSVFMPGFRKEVGEYLSHSHIFVLSSAWEGFGNVIVEALACGTQVVSTDCHSGPAEILENGKYGRLVPVRDPRSLATAVLETLANPKDPEFLRARARAFAPELIASQYIALFNATGGVTSGENSTP